MALVTGSITEDFNRGTSSPRPRARGCTFNHPAPQSDIPKKKFNVDSPSFVPSSLAVNGNNPPPKPSGLSPKSASAAPFKPRGTTPAPTAPVFTPAAKKYNPNAPDWVAPEVQEFFPQTYNTVSTTHFSVSWSTSDETFDVSRMEYYQYLLPNDYGPVQATGVNGDAPLYPSLAAPDLNTHHHVASFPFGEDAPTSPYHQQYSLAYHHACPMEQGTQYQDSRNFFLSQHDMHQNGGNNHDTSHATHFEPFSTPTPSLPSTSHTPQPQVNPYAQETGAMGVSAYYSGSNNYSQPLQHHLYADLGPHRDHLQPNQRTPRDFFIPEDLRQTLQKKTEATLTTFPNSTLPPNIAHYHTLIPLVHNNQKNTTMFGYSSWVYKAISSQDGKPYCLRRLQGYHLSDESTEMAIRSVAENWSRVRNANVVTVFLAFTNSSFGDSSLIFVTDYHPLSETLAQKHFTPASRFTYRNTEKQVTEQTLWSYIVQIANALKAIHSAGLAARVIDPSKVLLTGENRIRLNACAVQDVVKHNTEYTIDDLQRLDLHQLGQLILAVGTNNLPVTQSAAKAIDVFSRSYSPRLRDRVSWLLDHQHATCTEGIDIFLASIATDMVSIFDASLHLDDQLQTNLARELENSRITRLLVKLNFLNERPEYENDRAWSEQGNRYILQLFRDYVFHQVDSQGKPVLDLAHVLACLNKVDVGIEEKISLTARDENTVIIVTYREVRTAIEAAFGDLMRRTM